MAQSPSPKHEALCRRCGRCCYEKLIVDDHVFTLRKPCTYLDEATHLCRVYPRRHTVNPRCLTVAQGIACGVFPADCPYVKNLPAYVPAEEGWLEEDVARDIERGILRTYADIVSAIGEDGGG